MTATAQAEAPTTPSGRFLRDTQAWVLNVIKAMGLDENHATYIMGGFEEHQFTLKLLRDNGVTQEVPGSLVIWWPGEKRREGRAAKGGIRFALVANLQKAMALALLMMLKCALLGLPFDGAKCALGIDSRTLSDPERERLGIAFALKMIELRLDGPFGYVGASDIGSGPRDMDAIRRGFEPKHNGSSHACVTGKSLQGGGCPGREESTGRLAAQVAVWTADHLGIPLDQRTAAIQGGLGKVGYWTAYWLAQWGWRVQAIGDIAAGRPVAVFRDGGLSVEAIRAHIDAGTDNHLGNFPGARVIGQDEFLSLRVTSLVLAAMELALDEHNAGLVQANSVICPANGGITCEADAILHESGVFHAGLLSSSGGVGASGEEWLLALGKFPGATLTNPPSAETVLGRVTAAMHAAFLLKLTMMQRHPHLTSGQADIAAAIDMLLREAHLLR